MAGTRISALAALSTIADGDLLPVVDVSDTTQGPGGSTKRATAETIIDHFGGAFTVSTVADVRALTNTVDVRMLGFNDAGDGGNGVWRWDPTDITSVDNDGTVLVPDSGALAATGRWKRVFDGPVNARWFGVLPGLTDCTQALQNAVDYVGTRDTGAVIGSELFIPAGYYRFTFDEGASGLSTITVENNGVLITGEGQATILTVRSTGATVDYFFTFSMSGAVRGFGGGITNLRIDGNSDLKWICYLDTWHDFRLIDITATDCHGGFLDAVATKSTTIFGEFVKVRGLDYYSSSGSNSCFIQYGVRFRAFATTGGTWTDCWVQDVGMANVWYRGVLIDGCHRIHVDNIAVACNTSSSNTIDGSTQAGCQGAVELTNTVNTTITTDTGYHLVSNIYLESHEGSETHATHCAVWINATQAGTKQCRNNIIENVTISTNVGLGLLNVLNDSGVAAQVASNTFRGNRRAYLADSITIATNVYDTSLWLYPSANTAPEVNDSGVRTTINGSIGVGAGSAPSLNAGSGGWWSYPLAHTTAATVAGALYLSAVYVPRGMTLDRMSCEVTTGAGSSTISQVIYESDPITGRPGALLLNIGSAVGTVDGNVIAITDQTISQPLVGGRVYWFGMLVLGGTPTVRVMTGGSWSGEQSSSANALGTGAFRQGRTQIGLGSVPDPAATTSITAGMPLFAVRVV